MRKKYAIVTEKRALVLFLEKVVLHIHERKKENQVCINRSGNLLMIRLALLRDSSQKVLLNDW
jgi:hypothetical protein